MKTSINISNGVSMMSHDDHMITRSVGTRPLREYSGELAVCLGE